MVIRGLRLKHRPKPPEIRTAAPYFGANWRAVCILLGWAPMKDGSWRDMDDPSLPWEDDAMSLKQEDAPARRKPDAPEPRREALGCAWLACMRCRRLFWSYGQGPIATATTAGLGLAGTIMGTVDRLFNGVRLVDGLR